MSVLLIVFVALLVRRYVHLGPAQQMQRRPPIPWQLRRAVIDRNRGPLGTYSCTYCRRWTHSRRVGPDGRPWTLDHIVAYSRGGPTTYRNLTLSCWTCNSIKGNAA